MARGFVLRMVLWQWQQQQLEQKSLCFSNFSTDSEGTLGSFVVPFGRVFRHEIRWCFDVVKEFVLCMVWWQRQQQQLEQKSLCFSNFF